MIKLVLFCLILTSCAVPEFKPTGAYRHFVVSIIIDDNIIHNGEKVKGLAQCGNSGKERFCILRVPSIKWLDDEGWYTWGKELGHAYYDDYHKGVEDIY
jgi:hypothetical protein